jgi:biofilm PGA synthesis N-glycosyltransferase PgaC
MQSLSVSVGIFAHNEENNIKRCIESVQKQKTEVAEIKEILVISSGSNDRTNEIVRRMAKTDDRIILLEQFKREGKSSAVNYFIRNANGQILVAVSSDLRLHTKSIEEITLPFLYKNVGMVGGHPKPCNVTDSKVGKEVDLLWKLHHIVSLHNPKCGEIIAFRKVIRSIPKESTLDDATLEVLMRLIGFDVVYAPRSIVFNKAPITVGDFITQRKRNYSGHIWTFEHYNFKVSTMGVGNNLKAVIEYFGENPTKFSTLIRLLILEAISRFLGWIDYRVLGKNPYIWKMVKR